MIAWSTFDLETTSTSPKKAKVVQAALVSIDSEGNDRAYSKLFHATHIPPGAAAVHGIDVEQLAECPPFEHYVESIITALEQAEHVVTYNGTMYDLLVLDAYAQRVDPTGGLRRRLTALRAKHVDVFRAWKRKQAADPLAACYSGSLSGAHAFYFGETFDGAHDAANDCRATQRVLDRMLQSHDVETLVRWSSLPLPGCADMDGKLKWAGDTLTLTIGEHSGEDVAKVDRGFLQWMLRPDKDFAPDTCAIIRQVLAGDYPVRHYEDEV